VSDAAVNIAPDVDQKRDIIQNAIILALANMRRARRAEQQPRNSERACHIV
jgi:phosphotransacetylase